MLVNLGNAAETYFSLFASGWKLMALLTSHHPKDKLLISAYEGISQTNVGTKQVVEEVLTTSHKQFRCCYQERCKNKDSTRQDNLTTASACGGQISLFSKRPTSPNKSYPWFNYSTLNFVAVWIGRGSNITIAMYFRNLNFTSWYTFRIDKYFKANLNTYFLKKSPTWPPHTNNATFFEFHLSSSSGAYNVHLDVMKDLRGW